MTRYSEKLKDPRWQKKRLLILERDGWACQHCGDETTTLHVHHNFYVACREPWEYEDDALLTLCEKCHDKETAERPAAETELLHALRKLGWNASAVSLLAESLLKAGEITMDDDFSVMLTWSLQDATGLQAIEEAYWKWMRGPPSESAIHDKHEVYQPLNWIG